MSCPMTNKNQKKLKKTEHTKVLSFSLPKKKHVMKKLSFHLECVGSFLELNLKLHHGASLARAYNRS